MKVKFINIFENTVHRTFISIALLIIIFDVFSSTVMEYTGIKDPFDDIVEIFIFMSLSLPFVYFKLKKDANVKKLMDEKEIYYKSLYRQNPELVLTFDLEGSFLNAQ